MWFVVAALAGLAACAPRDRHDPSGAARSKPPAPPPSATADSAEAEPTPADGGRVAQCNVLVHAVNDASSIVQRKSKEVGAGQAADYYAMAGALDEGHRVITSAEVEDARLVELRAQYAAVIAKMATSMRDAGVAVELHDTEAAARAQADFERADAQEDTVRAAITQYCTKP